MFTNSIASEYWLANTNTVGAVGKVPSRNPNVAISSCVAVTLSTPCGRRIYSTRYAMSGRIMLQKKYIFVYSGTKITKNNVKRLMQKLKSLPSFDKIL